MRIIKILICVVCAMAAFSLCAAATEVQAQPSMQQPQNGQEDMQPPQETSGETGEVGNVEIPQGEGTTQMRPEGGRGGGGRGGMPPEQFGTDSATAADTTMTEAETSEESLSFMQILDEYQTPIISLLLLALAFVFVIFYKNKTY